MSLQQCWRQSGRQLLEGMLHLQGPPTAVPLLQLCSPWAAAAPRAYSKPASEGSAATSSVSVMVGSQQVQVGQLALPVVPMSPAEQESLEKATELIQLLAGAGHYSLIVGGWVRDKFLGRPAADIDIATSALPPTVRSLPGVGRVLDLPRGVVKVQLAGEWFEVATFRGLTRTPGPASAAADARMRDFTCNALMYDPLEGVVLDAVGGVRDLAQQRLRLISEQRIREDPVRILRGIRFAVLLGLKMDAPTAAVLAALAPTCSPEAGLPPRRIWLELRKLAAAEAAAPGSTWPRALGLAAHLKVLPALFPWLRAREAAVAEQVVRVAGGFPGERLPLELLVAATVHPGSGPAAYQQVLQYFPAPEQQRPIRALSAAAALLGAQRGDAASWAPLYGDPQWPLLLDILAAWMPVQLQGSFKQYHQAQCAAWQQTQQEAAAAATATTTQQPSAVGTDAAREEPTPASSTITATAAGVSLPESADSLAARLRRQEEEVEAQRLFLQTHGEGES